MKVIWSTICVIAVLNLVGLICLVTWLCQSGRLTMERAVQIQFLISEPVARKIDTEPSPQPPSKDEPVVFPVQFDELIRLDSQAKIDRLKQIRIAELLATDRMRFERDMLMNDLTLASSKLQRDRTNLEHERTSWETSVQSDRERKNDEQFAQIIQQYELLPSDQAKEMLLKLINDGNMKQAVTYLDAMNSRTVTKILREFQSDSEVALATELLEHLRRFGLDPQVEMSESVQHDDDFASANAVSFP